MTKKEIVTRLYEVFIVNQAKQSSNTEGRCLYSHDVNGYGCAVGCLLPQSICETLDELDEANIVWVLQPHDDEEWLEDVFVHAIQEARNVLGTDSETIDLLHSYQLKHDSDFGSFLNIIRSDYMEVSAE